MRIQIIDDDEDVRDVMGVILRAEGHEVTVAADGLEALAWLRAGGRPQVILLDMMMPRLDGEGFLRALMDDPSLSSIPVIVESGHAAARQRAKDLGAADCLVKPIELSDLLRAIRSAAADAEARA
jgi:CheY-like chemotaxis protein